MTKLYNHRLQLIYFNQASLFLEEIKKMITILQLHVNIINLNENQRLFPQLFSFFGGIANSVMVGQNETNQKIRYF